MKYTSNMGLRKPEGGEYYSIEDFSANADMLDGAVTAKANKPASFTLGNLTSVGTGGNLEDSGKKPTDFAGAKHSHDAAYATISHVRDLTVHIGTDEKAAIAAVANKADRTYVDSALSTKANVPQLMTGIASLNNILSPGQFYIDCNGEGITNTPYPTGSFSLLVELNRSWGNGVKQTWSSYNQCDTWTRLFTNGSWSTWERFATATPPQEFNLPLLSGFDTADTCSYCKDQFGRGLIYLAVKCTDEVPFKRGIYSIAKLPIGDHPNHTVHGTAWTSSGDNIPIGIMLGTDGHIRVRIESDNQQNILGSITFQIIKED